MKNENDVLERNQTGISLVYLLENIPFVVNEFIK